MVIKSRRMSRRHLARIVGGGVKNALRILFEKNERERPLGRTKCRWENNIIIGLREGEWKGVNWMHLAQDRDQWRILMKIVMNLQVP
jgi:hypothetical protein